MTVRRSSGQPPTSRLKRRTPSDTHTAPQASPQCQVIECQVPALLAFGNAQAAHHPGTGFVSVRSRPRRGESRGEIRVKQRTLHQGGGFGVAERLDQPSKCRAGLSRPDRQARNRDSRRTNRRGEHAFGAKPDHPRGPEVTVHPGRQRDERLSAPPRSNSVMTSATGTGRAGQGRRGAVASRRARACTGRYNPGRVGSEGVSTEVSPSNSEGSPFCPRGGREWRPRRSILSCPTN